MGSRCSGAVGLRKLGGGVWNLGRGGSSHVVPVLQATHVGCGALQYPEQKAPLLVALSSFEEDPRSLLSLEVFEAGVG